MHASALDTPSNRRRNVLVITIVASVVLHAVAVWAATKIKVKERTVAEWVQMVVQVEQDPVPPPEPVPEPEPEPEQKPKEKKPPKEVDASELPDEPTEQEQPEAEPESREVRRLVQGLDNNSFLEGMGGFGAKRGNTTATRQTDEELDPDDAEFSTVPFAGVSAAPAIRRKPALPTPDEVRDNRIEGTVETLLTIGPDGSVLDVAIVASLHPAADRACAQTLQRSSWSPGQRDGAPVIVTGVPYSCRYELAVD